ncbi:MAG: hypothetical protein RQ745_01895 [Longimicrobiales bacterium]|nr:hypothetical protein [Longimicrobiales bacterium]
MRKLSFLAGVVAVTACVSTTYNAPLSLTPPIRTVDDSGVAAPTRTLEVDAEKHQIEIVAGPFTIPAVHSMDPQRGEHQHFEGMKSPLIPINWPVDGGMAGFRMAVYKGDGTPLPRDVMHHAIAVNFDRRQLVYPVAERLFGFGTETPDIRLPDFLEVPLERGDSIGFYAMWNNTTGEPLEDIYLQLVIPYAAPGREREAAMPFYVDTNNNVGGETSFDLPPGISEHAWEFEMPIDGGLLAASGHLHDYGVELRLEEVETGRALTTLRAERDPGGRVEGVEQKIYRRFFKLLDARIEFEAGKRYRVVGVYDNPTGEVIFDGGMAHIVGLFAPRDPSAWPEVDPTDEMYQRDVAALPLPLDVDSHAHHD